MMNTNKLPLFIGKLIFTNSVHLLYRTSILAEVALISQKNVVECRTQYYSEETEEDHVQFQIVLVLELSWL